jgi:signal transduction histidine kinase
LSVDLVTAAGSIAVAGSGGGPVGPIDLDPTAPRGTVTSGTVRYDDGRDHLYAATTLRGPNAAGPRAIVLSRPDTSAGDALRDLVRTLPVVIVLVGLIGAPIAYALSRSVTGPLRRLAAATADLATADPSPVLPLEGPAEVRELTGRFNAMAAELDDTRAREGRLLANLRHDLRTPLTVIGGFAAALADGTANGDDATRAAGAISEEAARLERLVDELDALERLRDGAAGLRPEWLDARGIVAETVARCGPGAAAAGVSLEAVDDPLTDAPGLGLAADRQALERILGNLVANAVAVAPTPGGHVWITSRAIPALPATGRPGVAFTVTDDGPGFAPGDAERAFERFYRGDPSRAGTGRGLGLAIVRELARAHGGEAVAENVAPRGARLSVLLPATPPPLPDPATAGS